MNIIAVPVGNMNTASSRIRCFRFMEFMPKEVTYRFGGDLALNQLNGDILYFQKVAPPAVVNLVKEYRKRGGKAVYDLDDDFGIWPGMLEKEMCDSVNAVTTDTEFRAEKLRAITSTPVHVIPDVIDYVKAKEPPVEIREKMESIVAFGSNHSVSIVAPTFNCVTNYRKCYIGQSPGIIPQCSFARWDANSFLTNLKQHDVAVLIHDANDAGNMKSNNRLLVCMSVGIPTIVSNTVAYSQTMKELGTDFLVLDQPSSINSILSQLEDRKVRQDMSDKFVQYVWTNFPPESSSVKLLELFKSL